MEIKLSGDNARNFFAELSVSGEKSLEEALKGVAKGSPMEAAIKESYEKKVSDK